MSQEQNNKTVKMGMFIGLLLTVSLYVTAYYSISTFENEIHLLDRIKLGFQCLLFPAFFMFIVILKVGYQRFGNSSENPTEVHAITEGMKIDLCVLSIPMNNFYCLSLTP